MSNKPDILETIKEIVALKESSKEGVYKGLCPFHNESTPSFFVDTNRQVFKCFGCGIDGDIDTFIEKIPVDKLPERIKLMMGRTYLKNPLIISLNTLEAFQSEVYRWLELARQGEHDGVRMMDDRNKSLIFEIRI